jgi:hypothetical protein
MSTMMTRQSVGLQLFDFTEKSLEQVLAVCEVIAKTSMVPKDYRVGRYAQGSRALDAGPNQV